MTSLTPPQKATAPTLKLFIWDNVLSDYTDGIAFALAENVEQARRLINKVNGWDVSEHLSGKPKVYATTTKVARAVWGGG